MTASIELPNTLSGLLRVAVHDARLVQADPRFVFNMSSWVEHVEDDVVICEVCLAGAVLVRRSGETLSALYGLMTPKDIADEVTAKKLEAINLLRVGAFARAGALLTWGDCYLAHDWSGERTDEQHSAMMLADQLIEEDYKDGYAGFDTYEKVADLLEGVGL